MKMLVTPRDVEISRSRSTAQALSNLLLAGPVNSRLVVSALKEAGFSEKQIRSARERLGVVIRRQGNRRAMCSIWALPEKAEFALSAPSGQEDQANMAPATPRAGDPVGCGPSIPVDQPGPGSSAQLAPSAGSRTARRVNFFKARGLAAGEALDLATALEVRDTTGGTSVSCIECQCWVQTDWCSAHRPAMLLHQCSFVRRDGP